MPLEQQEEQQQEQQKLLSDEGFTATWCPFLHPTTKAGPAKRYVCANPANIGEESYGAVSCHPGSTNDCYGE